jgi:hypothetical protein
MKIYTEEDLRKSFRAGIDRGAFLERNEYAPFKKSLDEDEYINSLNEVFKEEKIPFSYAFLRRKLDWEDFCDLTGIGYYATRNGFEIKDNETFEISESKAKEYNLI